MVKGAGFYSDIGNNARDLIQNYQSDHKLPLTTSTFDQMGGESFFRSVLSNMEAVYLKRNPTAKAVLELVRSVDNDQICYDHLAFRTFGVNGYGIDSIAKFFLDFGYTQKDELSFPEKKLKAYWFSPPSLSVSGDGSGVNGPLPRIFISELLVDQMSSQAQKIIQKFTEASVGGSNYAALASALGLLTWEAPLFSEFQELARESEYAAWTLVNGFAVNHVTISAHRLKSHLRHIRSLNQFIEENGFKLSSEGGVLKVSPDGLLLQSSTLADSISFSFSDGVTASVPCSYIEFAERLVLPEFKNLPEEEIKEFHRRDGFEVENADKIFESTSKNQPRKCSNNLIQETKQCLPRTSLSLLSAASASPPLGTWALLHRSVGISAMHMQLLRTGHVIVFDRTDFGSSNLSLPRGTPCRLALDDVLPLDCSAHSLLFSPSRNAFRPLSIETDVFCSSGAVDPGGTLVQTGGYLAGDRKIRVFRPCMDDDVAGCDWSELRQSLAVRRWYATNQILPDGRVIIVGGRKQFSYEFFPKTATSAASGFTRLENAMSASSVYGLPGTATSAASDFTILENATSAASDFTILENATSASDYRVGKSATSAASDYGLPKTATSAVFDYSLPETATSASAHGFQDTATSSSVFGLSGTAMSAAPAYRPTDATSDSVYSLPFLKSTTDPFEENNLYPFLHLLPNGDLFVFANRRSIQFNYKLNKIVREFPAIPGEKRNYPSSGSSVLLPLRGSRPDPEVMVCGGAPDGAYYMANNMSVYVSASNTCGRLKITTGLDPGWEMESMPMNRVMSDMLLLPTGDVLIINGASNGTAGWEDATGPVLNPVLYNPTRRRFIVLNPTVIPRMYHSAAILLPDGRILVGGSNPHKNYNFTADNYPTDLSLEAFYPPYMSPDYAHLRPSILSVETKDEIVSYGHNFSLTFVGPLRVFDRGLTASLIAPPFTTHAFGMNQRLVFLDVIGTIQRLPLFGYKVMLRGPSSANIAPPGYYMLFLAHVGVPGECVWVKVDN